MRYFKWAVLLLLVVIAIINLPIDDQSRFAPYQDKIKGYQETVISAGKELFSSLPNDSDSSYAQSGEFKSGIYGGPYGYKLTTPQKLIDFGYYTFKGLEFSEGQPLTQDLFCDSVYENLNKGSSRQKYTYIINAYDNIIVSTWKGNRDLGDLGNMVCDGTGETLSQYHTNNGRMIDFSPEDNRNQSPCWLKILVNEDGEWIEKPQGILDAMSKHFMLAQEQPTISAFQPALWLLSTVEFAGEIIVDVDKEYYVININSGTYRPDAEEKFLPVAAKRFGQLLNEIPRIEYPELNLNNSNGDLKLVCPDLIVQ